MIKYQHTILDILLVEQDGSTGVTKVGYCGPHPTKSLPAFYIEKKYGRDFWEHFFFLDRGNFFPLPHGVLKRNLILLSEIPQTHTYYTG